ncbi:MULTISPECIES: DUF2790 domain-containing protein [Pseudomonas]|jgi:hypothetical protein|uniref:DUF2790 domain-containing protein n=1 Tax=Pseudomonas fluorescens TaxID=294 RepID=A0A5E7PXF7_PSEFL|nr:MULTISPECIES: DUF2790 domain-containing protein [Pseudomonas]KPG92463.1 hypothetical protein AK821_25550 [Pseudomonas sp. RIT-PI-r]MCP1487397.1 hypothetical protein [Pseudomonas fluorescens]PRB44063.1 DUF2790 domain-containing protein [Pseudomonas sp. MYb3]PRC29154.1 DUF2790 domain-containing protein [Pseudomonas sp. MYb2]VVP53700.1 hypothetical protein PS896_05534 [Pseudomonas fluorescens]
MNNKSVIAACLFAALNICTLSARAEADVTAQTYTYGTHLDIHKVLSLKQDNSVTCGIVEARMTYLDSAGQTRVLDYSKFADGCNNDN